MYWRLCGGLLYLMYLAGKPPEKTWGMDNPFCGDADIHGIFIYTGGGLWCHWEVSLPRKAPVY